MRCFIENNGLVKVYLDGKLVDEKTAGIDVKNGMVTVDQPRLYNMIDLKGPTEIIYSGWNSKPPAPKSLLLLLGKEVVLFI